MQNSFLTTVLAGVIVALISAIAAYYFAGRQERQRQSFARQLEEQRQLGEKQQSLNERRISAFDELRAQARSRCNAFIGWTERVASLELGALPESLPDKEKKVEAFQNLQETLAAFSGQVVELREQGNKIHSDISSLWDSYVNERPRFDSTTRSVFESFYKELEKRHTSVANALKGDPTTPEGEYYAKVNENIPTYKEMVNIWWGADDLELPWKALGMTGVVPVFALGQPINAYNIKQARRAAWKELREAASKYVATVKEEAEHAQSWDLRAQFDALDQEAFRLLKGRP